MPFISTVHTYSNRAITQITSINNKLGSFKNPSATKASILQSYSVIIVYAMYVWEQQHICRHSTSENRTTKSAMLNFSPFTRCLLQFLFAKNGSGWITANMHIDFEQHIKLHADCPKPNLTSHWLPNPMGCWHQAVHQCQNGHCCISGELRNGL